MIEDRKINGVRWINNNYSIPIRANHSEYFHLKSDLAKNYY